jgi:hypothetical protein
MAIEAIVRAEAAGRESSKDGRGDGAESRAG